MPVPFFRSIERSVARPIEIERLNHAATALAVRVLASMSSPRRRNDSAAWYRRHLAHVAQHETVRPEEPPMLVARDAERVEVGAGNSPTACSTRSTSRRR